MLSYDALADGITAEAVIDRIVVVVPLPQVAPHTQALEGDQGSAWRTA